MRDDLEGTRNIQREPERARETQRSKETDIERQIGDMTNDDNQTDGWTELFFKLLWRFCFFFQLCQQCTLEMLFEEQIKGMYRYKN